MKKYLSYILLGSLLFFLPGCSFEHSSGDSEEVLLDVPFTRAGYSAYEDKIITARMIVVRSAGQSNGGQVVVNTITPLEEDILNQKWVKFKELVPVGFIDIYIFTNELASWGLGAYAVGTPGPTLGALQAKILDLNNYPVVSGTPDYPPVDATHAIPMFLYHQNVKLAIDGSLTKEGIPLTSFKAERIWSKVELQINCPYSELPDSTPISLDSVYIRRMPQKSWLLPQTYSSSHGFFDGTYYASPADAELAWNTDSDLNPGFYHEYVFYIPEYIVTDYTLPTYLVITAHRDSNPLHRFHYTIVLGNGLATKTLAQMRETTDPADLRISRNTHYLIQITKITAFGEDDVIPIHLNPSVTNWTFQDIILE
ncbi:MAG: hypothetical protein FWD56_01930 [Bacteroidales bacterium]|nr:hypothetical protein [Bacteroidales bacterium]